MRICTRFAPSPTGDLHIGSVRTALFSWLYARQHQGKFILRIEDTDLERSTQASIDIILEGMAWLGLHWDQGPYYQTQRFDRYQDIIQRLLDTGHAYRCYCSKERIEALRHTQMAEKQKPRYDGHCRDLDHHDTSKPHVIRFRNPQSGNVVFSDSVHGQISIANAELDDLIIARQDGSPTYNLTVVVDDMDMQITHVIRGDDHINNTPRQINIFQALGAPLPQYVHVPMILGQDGKRLSKRHGAVSILQYRDEGYLPQAMLNYLVRLGWSHGDQEIFSIEDMVKYFSVEKLNKASAKLDMDKLDWLNQHYLKSLPPRTIADYLTPYFNSSTHTDLNQGPALTEVIMLQRERAKTLKEMATKSLYFYQDLPDLDEKAAQKHLKPSVLAALTQVYQHFIELEHWTNEAIHQVIISTAEAHALKLGKLAQPIRVAVTGGTVSPPIDATIHLIGKERTLKRLHRAQAYIKRCSETE